MITNNSDDNGDNDDYDDLVCNDSDVDDNYCLSSKLNPKTSNLVKYNQNDYYYLYQALKPQTLYNTSSILS